MTAPSPLGRALVQYARATARFDKAARSTEAQLPSVLTDLAAYRKQWEAEARTHGATDSDLATAREPAETASPPSVRPSINVEIRSLDQHGDPGFMHYRGDFYTEATAARFALTQAAALSAWRESERVAVSIDVEIPTGSRTDLEFVGTPGELATELASLRDYAPGARRASLPAPEHLTHAAERINAATPSLPEGDFGSVDVLAVEVHSTRTNPLPNSTTDIGIYEAADAHRIAEELAGELRGTVALTRGDSTLRVTHAAEITETDRTAVERYNQVERLRTNIAALDPTVDAEHIATLSTDLEELRARRPAAQHSSAHIESRPLIVSDLSALYDPVPGAGKTGERPRGLVSAPQQPSTGTARASTDKPALPPTWPAAPSFQHDHGIN